MNMIELFQECIRTLGNIYVPAALTEQISVPVYNVRQDLVSLVNQLNKPKEEEKNDVNLDEIKDDNGEQKDADT